jgi:sugar (pentulose or hexulose) kinase
VSAATDADTLYRGIVEGVAMTYARVADELHPAAPQVVEVAAAVGSATASPSDSTSSRTCLGDLSRM